MINKPYFVLFVKPAFSKIAPVYHDHCLPNTETNSRSHTPIESLDTIVFVDPFGSSGYGHFFRSTGSFQLRLHFHANNFNRLIPGWKSTLVKYNKPPMADASIFWGPGKGFFSSLLPKYIFRICSSAKLERPNLDPQLVHCLTATAFTPLLIPRIPSLWNISRAILIVDRFGPVPFDLVTSTVWIKFIYFHESTESHGCICLSNTSSHASQHRTAKIG